MAALQRIGVLVQRGAVEMAEAMRVVGKMPGHPVEPHGDAFAMARFDQRGKILRRAEPAGRRIQAGRLIAPGAVERMFADGQKLDMREAEIPHIGRKLLGQFAIGQPFIVTLAPPRAEMDLVDRDRRAQGVQARRRGARAGQFGLVENDRGGLGTDLGGKRERIGFHRQMLAVRFDDIELVMIADAGLRNEQLPIADAAHAHRMTSSVPEIEIADDADALGVRRQHHEGHAVDAVERHRMRAELVVDPLMGAFAEQMEIEVAQDRRKAVGVVELDDIVAEAGAKLILCRAVRQRAGEQPGLMDLFQRRAFAVFADRLDISRFREERAHDFPVAFGVKAEIAERIGVAALDDRIGLGGKFGHAAASGCCERIRIIPVSGTRNQSGRCDSSYSTS